MTCKRYDGKRGITYFYSIDVAPRGAPRKQVQRRGFRSKRSCEAARSKELTERHEGTYIEPSRESVGSYLTRWRAASAPRWRPSTQERVAAACATIAAELGDVPLGRLDGLAIQSAYTRLLAGKQVGGRQRDEPPPENVECRELSGSIQRCAQQYSRKPLAPSTLRYIHIILKQALTQAVRWKVLRDNPAAGVSLPHIPASPVEAWSAEERATFLAAALDDPLYPLWLFMLDSGCRIGEALALQWHDVDLSTRYVQIRRTLTRNGHNVYMIGESGKTPAARRSIQLNAETVAAMQKTTLTVAPRGHDSPLSSSSERWHVRTEARAGIAPSIALVFPAPDGSFWHPATVNARLHAACLSAGVPVLTSHGLRKTMTTLWLMAGVNPAVVAARLGHRTVQMTLNVYTKVSRAWGEQGVDQVAAYLEKTANTASVASSMSASCPSRSSERSSRA